MKVTRKEFEAILDEAGVKPTDRLGWIDVDSTTDMTIVVRRDSIGYVVYSKPVELDGSFNV